MWMGYRPEDAVYLPWIVWGVSWIIAARWANRTLKRPGGAREWPYLLLELGGFAMLLAIFVRVGQAPASGAPVADFLERRFWDFPDAVKWGFVALTAFGFLFCWWARIHLGRLWSGSVTRKEGHRIVDSGPYAIVRHPIYTGVLTAALGTMLVKGTGHAVVGVGMLLLAYLLKASLEERFLRGELGAADYDAYAKRVPMLVPVVGV